MTTTIELVNYKIVSDADDKKVAACQEKINHFCLSQAGFLYRSISTNESGTWFDIVYWQDMSSAQKAAENFGKSGINQDMDPLIVKDSLTITHMQAITEAMATEPEPA